MARTCIVDDCNRTLRTGRKYCWEHRSEGYAGAFRDHSSISSGDVGGFGIIILIFLLFGLSVKGLMWIGQWFKAHVWVFYFLVAVAILAWVIFVYIRFFE